MVRALRVGRMFMLMLFPFGPAVIVTVAQSDNAIDRDHHDAGLLTANADPVALCELGLRSRAFRDPVQACRAAFNLAMEAAPFNFAGVSSVLAE